jgi:carboxymethylenebutenolidase
MGHMEPVTIDGGEMNVYMAEPSGAGPHPAILLTFHRGGIDEFTCKYIDDLAAAGYVAAAPNFYHRSPADADAGDAQGRVIDSDMVADMNATVAMLQSRDSVQGDAIGIVGHCFGGRNSYLGAATNSAFKACAVFYGGNTMVARGEGRPTPFELMKNITCPLMGFFGNDDQNPSPDDIDKIDAELTRHGVRHVFHRYDGAGHAFQNFTAPERYREEAAKDAQAKLLVFLSAELNR